MANKDGHGPRDIPASMRTLNVRRLAGRYSFPSGPLVGRHEPLVAGLHRL